MPVKTCVFNNSLLQEHFNDNYLETDKYPNATYKGTLGGGFTAAMLTKDGTYHISSSGQLTLHGVTQPFSAPVTLVVSGKTATFTCQFKIKAADYKIAVPSSVSDKILAATPVTAVIKFAL
jgi:polyisoprenoid-binding protein YceI